LTTITFCNLSAFGRADGFISQLTAPWKSVSRTSSGITTTTTTPASTPREEEYPSTSRTTSPLGNGSDINLTQMSTFVNPGRLVLSIFSGGEEVWCGGVTPGSIDEEEGVLAFDLLWSRGGRGSSTHTAAGGGSGGGGTASGGALVAGDVLIALWFGDHKAVGDPPRLAYAFHTAFVDHSTSKLKLKAQDLDIPEMKTPGEWIGRCLPGFGSGFLYLCTCACAE